MEEIKKTTIEIDKIELARLKALQGNYDCRKKWIPYTSDLPNEVWKRIPKSNYYFCSDMGRVRKDYTLKNGEFKQFILTPRKKDGKLYLEIRPEPNVRITLCIHLLVAELFLGKKDLKKYDVIAKDYDRQNCRLDNLEWINKKKRIRRKPELKKWREYINKNGTLVKRASHLSNADIEEIIQYSKLGLTQRAIADKLKITQQYVSLVLRNKINY